MRLTVELIPKTAWGANVRSEVSKSTWDSIRRKVYKAANYVCEVCGSQGSRHPVECHERWDYDDTKHVQTLVGFIALCPTCHRVKHIGRAIAVGLVDRTVSHLRKINNTSQREALDYIDEVFYLWEQRSKHAWTVDISYITKFLE